ncbi:MAG: leucine-rich repeat domain-containing protein [Bacteroidales bacterium]|nr:leucine-rich repeat domain-containing protein [Bacteroidales bacterium]
MKRLLLSVCAVLFAHLLSAQVFQVNDLTYSVTSTDEVKVHDCSSTAQGVIIPSIVSHNGASYVVTSIGDQAFYLCHNLISVVIPETVLSIGNEAFNHCTGLTTLTIPSSVTSIGNSAFANTYSLTSMTIPDNVVTFGNEVFRNSGVSDVTLGNGINSIGSNTFNYCTNLTTVTLGNGITSIGEQAFMWCENLTSINIPATLTSLAKNAFAYCESLTSIELPSTLTSIAEQAFIGCASLPSVIIPEGITRIEASTFRGCSSMIYVEIPESVTYIGTGAFAECTSMTYAVIPSNVNYIGYSAFADCSNLVSLTFNATDCIDFNMVEMVGWIAYPFVNCPIGEVVFGENVEKIPAYFLSDASVENLTYFTIPSSVESIGQHAFDSCYNLQNVECKAIEPPTIANLSAFPNSDILTLTVPCGTLDAYTASGSLWNQIFADIDQGAMAEITELSATICGGETYTENGFNASETGVYRKTFQSIEGCDSIVSLSLTVNPSYNYTITATINAGETYTENGFNESEAGTYVQNHQTILGCDSTITLVLTINSSLADVEEDQTLSFYPNPTKGELTFDRLVEKIEIIDLAGKTVGVYENKKQLNIETLPSGAYYLRMTIGDKTITKKVIKE